MCLWIGLHLWSRPGSIMRYPIRLSILKLSPTGTDAIASIQWVGDSRDNPKTFKSAKSTIRTLSVVCALVYMNPI